MFAGEKTVSYTKLTNLTREGIHPFLASFTTFQQFLAFISEWKSE